MVYRVFSILDVKSEIFSPPFFMASRGEALRAFKDLCNDTGTALNRHPDDFKLLEIGRFDNEQGVLEAQPHESMGMARDYRELAASAIPLSVKKGA